MTVRNRPLERAFLAAAERHAGAPAEGYAAAVTARLDRYGRQHGDTFDERTLDELLAEVDGEALPPAARSRLESTLDAIASLGAETHALVARARRTLAAHHGVGGAS